MPVFSFTAPIITPEEEQKERESLGEEGLSMLRKDLYGEDVDDDEENYYQTFCTTRNNSDNDNETQQQQEHDYEKDEQHSVGNSLTDFEIIEMVQEAMDQSVSQLEKKDYLEAMERVPELVQRESNPLAYYYCEDGNALAAAQRIAKYWKLRKKVFGSDDCFLPMTQSGALHEYNEALQKGFMHILPNDNKGRSVIFFDRIRAIPSIVSREEVIRVFFYILQKATNMEGPTSSTLGSDPHHYNNYHVDNHNNSNSTTTTESAESKSTRRTIKKHLGFVFIKNLQGYDLYTHFDRILVKTEMSLLRECFPSKLKAFHTCAGSGKWVVEMVLPVIKQIAGKYIRLHSVCHTGSTADILAELQCYNIDPENLSVIIGGNIAYQHYYDWLNNQFVIEQQEASLQEEGSETGGEIIL